MLPDRDSTSRKVSNLKLNLFYAAPVYRIQGTNRSIRFYPRYTRSFGVKYLVEKYAKQTTIHGVDRLLSGNTSKKERALWSVGFLIALILLCYMSLLFASSYQRMQFETVVGSTSYPLYRIPFPEIIICGHQRLNWARLSQAKQRFLRDAHQAAPYDTLFTDIMATYNTLIFGAFDAFADIAKQPLLPALNYINFTEVVGFMAWRCDEILEDCRWQTHTYNCCDIFFPRRSQLGQCLAFNSIESEQGRLKQLTDPMWPWHNGKYGPGTGLTVKFSTPNDQLSSISKKQRRLTFVALQHDVWFYYSSQIPMLTKTSITINANIHFYDKDTDSVPPQERQCFFEDEYDSHYFQSLEGYKYMYENCQSECQQRYVMHFCNCTMELFFPAGPYRACELVDLPCLVKYNDRWIQFIKQGEREYIHENIIGMECICFKNCQSTNYITDVYSERMKGEEILSNYTSTELDFYYRRTFIMVYRTKRVFNWVDLLVSFGGVTSLLLGCSLISLLELGYFLLVDVPKACWQMYKKSRKAKLLNKKIKLNLR